MPDFVVCSLKDNPDLEAKIKKEFSENNHYILRQGSQWLIDAEQTTKELAERLGITQNGSSPRQGEFPGSVVFLVSTYWGDHRKSLWEWLELD